MTTQQRERYEFESIMRAKLPPVAKHSQAKQPQKEAA